MKDVAVLLWIAAAVVIGALAPGPVLHLRPALSPAFAVTMFFTGTLVSLEEARGLARTPWIALVGVAGQYVLMPAVAWVVAAPFDDPALRTGILLLGCLPTAMASNVMTVLLRGDIVCALTWTTLGTVLCPLALRAWGPVLQNTSMTVPIGAMVWGATWMVVLPTMAGIALRSRWRKMAERGRALATSVASKSIALIVMLLVADNGSRILQVGPKLAAALLALNLAGYGLGAGLAAALRLPRPARRALVIDIGMKNGGLGAVLAMTHLGQAAAIPSASYGVLCLATVAVALLFRRHGEP